MGINPIELLELFVSLAQVLWDVYRCMLSALEHVNLSCRTELIRHLCY
jgi:hypothetical protein